MGMCNVYLLHIGLIGFVAVYAGDDAGRKVSESFIRTCDHALRGEQAALSEIEKLADQMNKPTISKDVAIQHIKAVQNRMEIARDASAMFGGLNKRQEFQTIDESVRGVMDCLWNKWFADTNDYWLIDVYDQAARIPIFNVVNVKSLQKDKIRLQDTSTRNLTWLTQDYGMQLPLHNGSKEELREALLEALEDTK